MEVTKPTTRFGLAIVSSAVLVASFAWAVHLAMPPETPLRPTVLTHESALLFEKAASAPEAVDPEIHRVLTHFVAALERRDQAGMRTDFPTMTRREERMLRSIRARLGYDAQLILASDEIGRAHV